LTIAGLSKAFGDARVVADLNLQAAEGEMLVLVGPSGCGKTTTLRCIAGLERPDSGEIEVAGAKVYSSAGGAFVPAYRRPIGMVFQSYAVWPHLTVYENVALPLAEGAQRAPRREVSSRAREALRLVQLEELADRSATLLSGGQQQRVALARAIAVNPRILLMDEPLSNLDARLREEVRGKIRDLSKQLGSTVLYVTHDQVEAMAMADKIALMQAGELLQVGLPMELYHRPARPEVAEFFGLVNWVEGKMVQPALAETAVGAIEIKGSQAPGSQVLLGFRPESLSPVSTPPAGARNVLSGVLRSSTFLGDQFLYDVMIRDHLFVGKGRLIPSNWDGNVCFYVDPREVMVFPAKKKILARFNERGI